MKSSDDIINASQCHNGYYDVTMRIHKGHCNSFIECNALIDFIEIYKFYMYQCFEDELCVPPVKRNECFRRVCVSAEFKYSTT